MHVVRGVRTNIWGPLIRSPRTGWPHRGAPSMTEIGVQARPAHQLSNGTDMGLDQVIMNIPTAVNTCSSATQNMLLGKDLLECAESTQACISVVGLKVPIHGSI